MSNYNITETYEHIFYHLTYIENVKMPFFQTNRVQATLSKVVLDGSCVRLLQQQKLVFIINFQFSPSVLPSDYSIGQGSRGPAWDLHL